MWRTLSRSGYTLLIAVLLGLLAACGSPEERAQSHYERGLELMEEKNLAKAQLEFKNAVQINGNLAGAWYGLAEIAEQRQNFEDLGGLLQKVVELDIKHADARLRLARLSLLRAEFDRALQLINAADELRPGNGDILTTRAATLLKLGDRQGALADAEKALALDPADAEALTVIAADKLSFGDTTGALAAIDRGLASDPFDLGLLLFKMKTFEEQKNLEGVEGIMRTIVAAHPREKDFRRALASHYAGSGRKDEAEREMRALADAAPDDDVEAVLELAEFLRAVKGPDAARDELARRIKGGGDQAGRYRLALARVEFADGKFDIATEILNGVIGKGEPREDVRQAKVLLAQMLVERKDAEGAGRLIGEVLTDDARNVDALHLRAALLLGEGKLDEAIADARQALNEKPDAVNTLQLLALALERSGSIELAEERLADAMKASNLQPAAVLKYADFLGRRGAFDRADDLLTRVTAQRPNDSALLSALAAVRLRREDWEGAQNIAEALKKLGDKSGVADQILGSALAGQNKFDDSIRTFQSAYQATPAAVRPMYSLVMAYLRAQKIAEAETFLGSVLKASPANAEAMVLLGSLQARNAADEAAASFGKAIASQPRNPIGYAALARFHLGRRDLAAAETAVRSGLAKIPGQFALRMTLASVLEQKNDIDAAIGEYETLLKDYPDSLIVVNNLASLLSDHRTDKESLDRAHGLALRLKDGQAPHFRDTTGWISYLRGDYRQALSHLEQAVEQLPSVALVRYHLGLTHAALEQKAKAKEHLLKAVELAPEGELRRKAQEALTKVKTAAAQ